MPQLSDLEFIHAQPLFDYLRVDSGSLKVGAADVIFILGGGSIGPANTAVKLYRNRVAPVIGFTSIGGTFGGNVVFGAPETETYLAELRMEDVPYDAIALPTPDEYTTNTLVEAQGLMPFLKRALPDKEIRQVALCSRSVHQRRAWATFVKQNPDVTFFNAPDDEYLTIELLGRMVDEVDRLDEYGAKGDLSPQEIPDEVREIVEALRQKLGR